MRTILIAIAIAFPTIIFTAKPNITSIYPVVDQQYLIPIQELFNGRFLQSSTILKDTSGAFSLSQQVYQQQQYLIDDTQNSQNKIAIAQQYSYSNPNIPTGAYAYLGSYTETKDETSQTHYFISQFSYVWNVNNTMTNNSTAQISQDELNLNVTLTSGYDCLSLQYFYVYASDENQIMVICLSNTDSSVKLIYAPQDTDGTIGNFSNQTYSNILPSSDSSVVSMKTQMTQITFDTSILSALFYYQDGTNIFAQYLISFDGQLNISQVGTSNTNGVVDFYFSINQDLFLLYDYNLTYNNQTIQISNNSKNQVLGVYNSEVNIQKGQGGLYYLSIVQQTQIQYLQISTQIQPTVIQILYQGLQINPGNGTVNQCFLSPEFAVYISNKQAFAQVGPSYQQIYGTFTPYIWIKNSQSQSSASYMGLYDPYNNLLILSTPTLPYYFQFNQAYLSGYLTATGSGSLTIQASFSDGSFENKTINFDVISNDLSQAQVHQTSLDEGYGFSQYVDLNDVFVGQNLSFSVNSIQLQKVQNHSQQNLTNYINLVKIPSLDDEFIQLIQNNTGFYTLCCSSQSGQCSYNQPLILTGTVQQAQIDYNYRYQQYVLVIQYSDKIYLEVYYSSTLFASWINQQKYTPGTTQSISNFLFVQNQLIVSLLDKNQLVLLSLFNSNGQIKNQQLEIDELNPQNIWTNPYTYGNLLFVDNGNALWILSLNYLDTATVMQTIPYKSNDTQNVRLGLLDQGIYIVTSEYIQFYQRSIINSFTVNQQPVSSQQFDYNFGSNSVSFSQNKLYLISDESIYVLQASASSIGSIYTVISGTANINSISAITFKNYDISCYLSNQVSQCFQLLHQQLINTKLSKSQNYLVQQLNLAITAESQIANSNTSATISQYTSVINDQTNYLTSSDETLQSYFVPYYPNNTINTITYWSTFFSPNNTFLGPIDEITASYSQINQNIIDLQTYQMVSSQLITNLTDMNNLESVLYYNDESYLQSNTMIMMFYGKSTMKNLIGQSSCQILFNSTNNPSYPINSVCYNSSTGLQLTQFKSDLTQSQTYTYPQTNININGVAYVDESVFMMYTQDEIYLCFTYSKINCTCIQNLTALQLIPFNLNISKPDGSSVYNNQSFGYIVKTSSDYQLYTMIYSYKDGTTSNKPYSNLNTTINQIFTAHSQFYENIYQNAIQIIVISSKQINQQKFDVSYLLVSQTANIQFQLTINWSPTLQAFGATHNYQCGYAKAVDTTTLPYASTINNLITIPYQYQNGDIIFTSYQTSNPKFGGNSTQLCYTSDSQELTLLYYLGSTKIKNNNNITFSQFMQNNQLIVQNSSATNIISLLPQYIINGTYNQDTQSNNFYIQLIATNLNNSANASMKINQVQLATYDQKNFSGKYLGIILGGLAFIGLVMAAICYQTTQKARDQGNLLLQV